MSNSATRALAKGRLQTTNRYTLTIPWIEPFADPAIYEHPIIVEFLDRFWRPDSYVITCYHSNTPCAGSAFQHWHRDTGIAREIPPRRPRNRSGGRRQVSLGRDLGRKWQL